MKTFPNIHLAPEVPLSAAASPLGGDRAGLATIRLDETNTNREPDPSATVTGPEFSMEDIITDTKPSQDAKMPSNQGKPTTTKKPQKFEESNPSPEETEDAAEVDEGRSPEETEAQRKHRVENTQEDAAPIKAATEIPPAARNYEGFDPVETKALKNMKNEHYTYMSAKLREYKAAETAKVELGKKLAETEKLLTDRGTPPSWYDHPEAYTLTPEFQELSSRFENMSAERSHYENQLVAIKEGREYTMILGYNKAGQPVQSQPIKPSNQSEVQLMGLLQQYGAGEADIRAKVAGLQGNFRQTHDSAARDILKGLDDRIATLIPELRPVEKDWELFSAVIPKPFQGHPMTKFSEKLYGITIKQAAMLAKLMEAQKTASKVSADVVAAGVDTRVLPRNGAAKPGNTPGRTVKLPNGKVVPASFDFENDFAGVGS